LQDASSAMRAPRDPTALAKCHVAADASPCVREVVASAA